LHLVAPQAPHASPSRPGATPLLDAVVTYPAGQPYPVTSTAAYDLAAHWQHYGDRPQATGRAGPQLIDTIEHLALAGRGGGYFPTAAKWRAHVRAGGGGVVVANGAESEPASAKDAALLQLRPHLVLDGLACAAEAVGAHSTIVWLHAGAHTSHASMVRAIAERRRAGLVEPDVRIAVGPERYLSGESSAIMRALSGGPALPEFRRAPGTSNSVPTLVHNIETLARTALAARPGAAVRTPTSLLTVATAAGRAVAEVAGTTPLWQVLDGILGMGATAAQQAVLLGGYGGAWIDRSTFEQLRADEASARSLGVSLGAGVLLPLHRGSCGLAQTSAIAEYLAAGSARQCGPCLFGLRAVADGLVELVELRAHRRDARRLQHVLAEISGRGACHHPDGAVRMVASALRAFATDARAHLHGAGCQHDGLGGFFPVPAGA
jgi:NADH:ubiquinone oxidoreductase subunit F (NADH-binding)